METGNDDDIARIKSFVDLFRRDVVNLRLRVNAVGDDAYGASHIENFRAEGIDVSFMRSVPGSSGVAPPSTAAIAVREQWDADEFYYPGEKWKRNRPSFRSVPAELLNKQSWYHWIDLIFGCKQVRDVGREGGALRPPLGMARHSSSGLPSW